MENSCDVLVLGGGGAGLTAAARIASISDKKVIVLEKSDFFGGGAIQAGDYRVYNSKWQKDRGLDDAMEEDLVKYMDETNWALDGRLVGNTFKATGRFLTGCAPLSRMWRSTMSRAGISLICPIRARWYRPIRAQAGPEAAPMRQSS